MVGTCHPPPNPHPTPPSPAAAAAGLPPPRPKIVGRRCDQEDQAIETRSCADKDAGASRTLGTKHVGAPSANSRPTGRCTRRQCSDAPCSRSHRIRVPGPTYHPLRAPRRLRPPGQGQDQPPPPLLRQDRGSGRRWTGAAAISASSHDAIAGLDDRTRRRGGAGPEGVGSGDESQGQTLLFGGGAG